MQETTQLWLFFILVFGVILLPGLDMAFVLASALVGGRASGFAATAGIVAGGVVHVTMGALGIVAVLQLVPAAFNVVLLAGALYIAWIGIGLLGSRGAFAEPGRERARTRTATFRQGMVTSLLNPKAYLFTLAVLPQFMKPEYGNVGAQAVVLWLIIALTQVAVYGGLALAGDRARAWFAGRPSVNLWLARGVGLLLLATAAFTAYEGWRSGAAIS
ncbi:MAG TPA: LysE family translocator [Steroidobacteraceae bacterium]|nr:LysE family translocator [Steroidobacteraceae bacterium]